MERSTMLFMGKSTINEPFSIVFCLVTRPGIHLKEIFTFAQVGCFSLKIVFILQDILEDFWRNLLIPVESWGFTNRFEKKNLRFKIVTRPGKLLHNELERSTIFSMGKSTISTGPFSNSKLFYGDFTCDCFNCFFKRICWAMLGCLPLLKMARH